MNVLLITTDQQRADTLGCYGNPLGATPRLDALAAQGTRYEFARTQHVLCQPARASILTGTYPSTHGVTGNGVDLGADAEDRSIATILSQAGHRTALFGKAHFATTFPFLPTGKAESVEGSARVSPDWYGPYFGFDHAEMVLFGHNLRIADLMGQWSWAFGPPPFGLHYARYLFRDGDEKGYERLRLMQPEAGGGTWDHTQTWASQIPEEDHPTTWIADRAIDWIKNVDEPFFAWVSFTDPHHPQDPPAPWSDRFSADDVDPIVPKLHKGELDKKPPLHQVFSTGMRGGPMEWANPGGGNYARSELATMNAGYYCLVAQLDNAIGRVLDTLDEKGIADDTLVIMTSDHGEFMGEHQLIFKGPFGYDSLLRVPLILRGPGIEAGKVVDDPVGTMDIAPTVLAAAGHEIPDWMDAKPLDAPHEHHLAENDFEIIAWIPMRTITTRRFKLHRYLEHPWGELYDLENDPGELVNLFDDAGYSGVRDDLIALCNEVMNKDVRRDPKVGLVA